MFTQGYAESGIVDMDAPYPSTRLDKTTDYDYDSDSDLDDEEDWPNSEDIGEDASDTAVEGSFGAESPKVCVPVPVCQALFVTNRYDWPAG